MEDKYRRFSTHELLPVVNEMIQSGRKAVIPVTGNSMRPFIAGNRDKVILDKAKRLKKGDVILFRNRHGDYILHRIYSVRNNRYKTIGDYCIKGDGLVEPESIIGVAIAFLRKGKRISCSSPLWRIYTYVWLALLPVRKYLIALHRAYIKAKTAIRQSGNAFVCIYHSLAAGLGLASKRLRGFFRHD